MEEKKRNWWKIGCLGFLGFIFLGGLLSAIAGDPPVDSADATDGPTGENLVSIAPDDYGRAASEAAPEVAENDPGISATEFAQLRAGMSYSQVVDIIGFEGELMSENEIAGYRTQMFMWDEEGSFSMGNANATFQNGEMVAKAQFGLD